LLDIDPEDEEDEDGAAMDLDANRKGKCAVIKTSTRQVRSRNKPTPHRYGFFCGYKAMYYLLSTIFVVIIFRQSSCL